MGVFSTFFAARFWTTGLFAIAIAFGLSNPAFAKETKLAQSPKKDYCTQRTLESPMFPLRTVSTVLQNEVRQLENEFLFAKTGKTCEEELKAIAEAITKLYVDKGYINSSASYNAKSTPAQIAITEGEVNSLTGELVTGLRNVSKDYIISRLQPYITKPFNAQKLEEGLLILNRDPNFVRVRATIVAPEPRSNNNASPDPTDSSKQPNDISQQVAADRADQQSSPNVTKPSQSTATKPQLTSSRASTTNSDVAIPPNNSADIAENVNPSLRIEVEERNQIQGFASIDNEAPYALGPERYGAGLSFSNLTNLGERLSLSYYGTITNGLNQYDIGYSIPVNPQDGRLSFRVAPSYYRITQPEFDFLGIRGTSSLYEVAFRQPIWRSSSDEFALSLAYAYQTGQTFIFNDLKTPFGIGPDLDGSTRTGVIKFSQDYTNRDDGNNAWALRSQFNLGTGFGIFNVSNNKIDSPNAPTSYFFSWNGQVQRLQNFTRDLFLIASFDAQLSADPLLGSQQFVIGGAQSVRGFRQNLRVGDNGVRFSLENRVIAARSDKDDTPTLQFAPFIDLGGVWNNPRNPNQLPSQNFIAAGGIGAILEPFKGLTMRLDYAIPFLQLSDKTNNLQDSSLYLKLNYQF